jgi:hypothetical protein
MKRQINDIRKLTENTDYFFPHIDTLNHKCPYCLSKIEWEEKGGGYFICPECDGVVCVDD